MELSHLLCLIFVAAGFLYRALKRNSRTLPFPPGPPPEPLIGNLRQIPRTYAWKTYAEWGKKYNSGVLSFTALGKHMVVLNSVQAVTDLLEKRGTIYSERDHNVMIQDIMSFKNLVFMPYNDTFRLHRKVINTALNRTASRNYYAIQEKETYALMEHLLDTPEQWISNLRRAANSIILTMTYGYEVTTDDDYLVILSERAGHLVRQAIPPSSFLANMLPALKHVPGWLPRIPFQTFAQEGKKLLTDMQELPWKVVKDQIASGVVLPSYTTRSLDIKGSITEYSQVDEEELIKSTVAIMYGAESDTSTTSVMNLIPALVLHPGPP